MMPTCPSGHISAQAGAEEGSNTPVVRRRRRVVMLYRPWGHFDWLIGRLGAEHWSLLGCAGTEERSTGLACHIGRARLDHARMVVIRDPEPLDAGARDALLARRKAVLRAAAFTEAEVQEAPLLEGLDKIVSCRGTRRCGAQRLIIDLTSLPKRWFFAMLQAALQDERFVDVIAYLYVGGALRRNLSENIGPLRPLPGFFADDGRSDHDLLIVGIGFKPSPLLPLLQDHRANRIRLIFPFPPGPPGYRRNWMFVREIEALTKNEVVFPPERVHIHMYDCPQVFDALVEMTRNGEEPQLSRPWVRKRFARNVSVLACCSGARSTSRSRLLRPADALRA